MSPPRLLHLPAELRNIIYEFLVVFDGPITPLDKLNNLKSPYECGHRQPNISLVCTQLRRESLPLFYSMNIFDMTWAVNLNCADWADAVGERNLRHLKSVVARLKDKTGMRYQFEIELVDEGTDISVKSFVLGVITVQDEVITQLECITTNNGQEKPSLYHVITALDERAAFQLQCSVPDIRSSTGRPWSPLTTLVRTAKGSD
jgi:hypothetical protein